ncbi:hypothetical protein BP6252_05517 [Coleophoma cylindrospora]|uniref:Uncharacterized protein n=1 Tax=Coleophoma cylindrospora TaxID=1849047 RepID=A0A3D8RUC4_9HELO|nr:hypothetical protein BP6252_05517 [Coleophoma cylindrospora]
MFGSNNKTTTTNNTGFLSKLRSSNRPATANKPIYTSSTRKTTGVTKKPKKTVATGPAPMSHHKAKPTMSQKIHGAATVVSGKMHNDHREVRMGEKEMEGRTTTKTSSGLFKKGNTRTTTR